MLVRLRRTFNEKLERFAGLTIDKKQMSKKELEMRESMNNAIRMVIVNSTLNFVFKLPQTLIPLENAIETFYYQSKYYDHCGLNCNFAFNWFSQDLRDSRVYYLMSDLSDWLFSILISIQLFVYWKFDRKINTGLDRLIDFNFEKLFSKLSFTKNS